MKMKTMGRLLTLSLLLRLLGGLLLLRLNGIGGRPGKSDRAQATDSVAAPGPTKETPQAEPADFPLLSAEPSSEPDPTPTPSPSPKPEPRGGSGYNAETYQIVSDMIFIRRTDAADGDAQIRILEEKLKRLYKKLDLEQNLEKK